MCLFVTSLVQKIQWKRAGNGFATENLFSTLWNGFDLIVCVCVCVLSVSVCYVRGINSVFQWKEYCCLHIWFYDVIMKIVREYYLSMFSVPTLSSWWYVWCRCFKYSIYFSSFFPPYRTKSILFFHSVRNNCNLSTSNTINMLVPRSTCTMMNILFVFKNNMYYAFLLASPNKWHWTRRVTVFFVVRKRKWQWLNVGRKEYTKTATTLNIRNKIFGFAQWRSLERLL